MPNEYATNENENKSLTPISRRALGTTGLDSTTRYDSIVEWKRMAAVHGINK